MHVGKGGQGVAGLEQALPWGGVYEWTGFPNLQARPVTVPGQEGLTSHSPHPSMLARPGGEGQSSTGGNTHCPGNYAKPG